MSATQQHPPQQNNSEAAVAAVKPAATNADLVTVSNVAEIFNAAGFAFKKIGELVQQLDQGSSAAAAAAAAADQGVTTATGAVNGTSPAATATANGGSLSHWDTGDVEQFQAIITNFNDELSKLSSNLKNKMTARLQAEHTDRLTPAAAADKEVVKRE
ncbi:hypothetical protein TYRP_003410 [Tyrophagus putrescentiae]|nr:hypothetical protein TYRP_003410 [Tyrophagus putrescentiae]